jgi:drug/metabolite transporter (DMT)-like permease
VINIKYGRYDRPSIAIAYCLTSMTLFSMQDAFVKWLATDYWLIQLLFIRSIVIVVSSGLFIAFRHGQGGFKTSQPRDHLLRIVFNFFAFVSYYLAVTQMPLANATSIALTAPLFMTALSGPLLREPVGIKRYSILILGFIGALVVIQPTANDLNLQGSIYALLGAFLFAMLAIQTRKMSKHESSELMVFYAALAFLLVTGIFMLFYWETPDPTSLALMLLLGVITLFAQYAIVQSVQYARVHVIAPFEYITVIWAILIGWYVFSEPPTFTMMSGASLIIAAGLGIIWYERIDNKRSAPPPINPV